MQWLVACRDIDPGPMRILDPSAAEEKVRETSLLSRHWCEQTDRKLPFL